jgi:hypothetical protein
MTDSVADPSKRFLAPVWKAISSTFFLHSPEKAAFAPYRDSEKD